MKSNSTKLTLFLSAIALIGGTAVPTTAMANDYYVVQQTGTLTGCVHDAHGEALTGASVVVVGTTTGTTVDADGRFVLNGVRRGAKVNISFIGYATQQVTWDGTSSLDIVLQEDTNVLNEAVVTAMGIVRKASSLTYSTQQVKSDDLMKVQDVNLVNSLEGKISGITITPSAGGAGGASKILLRGNKSILGNNTPLIVVDGVPMTNNIRGQIGAGSSIEATGSVEGSDPLSMINPDDIESMNVLKGANAAALYGSQAANGVVMITTKKGREGRLDVNFTSNVNFDTPLMTPAIQNAYGGNIGSKITRNINSWGLPVSQSTEGIQYVTTDDNFKTNKKDIYGMSFDKDTYAEGYQHAVHVRNAAMDDVAAFYRTGATTNNSISLSGGTEKVKSYFSYANSYSNGMVPNNNYVRNTFALRENFHFWKRVTIDINANYVTTRTRNRVGGGTCGNPIYDLYLMPRDIDLDYYRQNWTTQGAWRSSKTATQTYYVKQSNGTYKRMTNGFAYLGVDENGRPTGTMQNWAIQNGMCNNPYWLLNENTGQNSEDRFYGSAQGRIDIWDGLAFQARVSIDHTKYSTESHTAATTWGPNTINAYGSYNLANSRTSEIYTDYLLSYDKTFKDVWSVSATAGFVGHVIQGENVGTYVGAATVDRTGYIDPQGFMSPISREYNIFDPQAGGVRTTTKSKTSNWDRAVLATVQLGWAEKVYVDASYRRDWYRAFRQSFFDAPDNYGYFGLGASAVISEIFKLPEPISYLKYRLSYSEVGNSIPNIQYALLNYDYLNGTYTANAYNNFAPIPETTKSFETGFESQFFGGAMNLDVTYYNSAMCNSYLTIAQGSRIQPLNSGKIRNQGVELTVGYDWLIGGGWRWKTNVNFSYNHNSIISTYIDEQTGNAKPIEQGIAKGVKVRYEVGGQYGDMYSTMDFDRYASDVYQSADGTYNTSGNGTLVGKQGDIVVTNGKPAVNNQTWTVSEGLLKSEKGEDIYLGNMNSKYQLSWSNTFSWKNFTLYFLINGRIGGKVMSLTEEYLDLNGVSQRTADARDAAYAADLGIGANNERCSLSEPGAKPAMYINDGRNLVGVQDYYERLATNPGNYVYDATNFRLRELSFGYTFRNLIGEGKNLSLSIVARNLFFIYKDAPVDPDVSLSTGNGMNGFELFNTPSARSFGFNLKLNF